MLKIHSCIVQMAHMSPFHAPVCRARSRGFALVLLYEPSGILQLPHRLKQLELQLLLQRLQGSVVLQSGWQPGGKVGQQQQQHQQPQQPQQWAPEGGLTVVLLSAADGQWPLLAAATAAGKAAGSPNQQQQQQQQQLQQEGRADVDEHSAAAARDAAFSAPARLRARLQAAGGALAGAEPDFVVVSILCICAIQKVCSCMLVGSRQLECKRPAACGPLQGTCWLPNVPPYPSNPPLLDASPLSAAGHRAHTHPGRLPRLAGAQQRNLWSGPAGTAGGRTARCGDAALLPHQAAVWQITVLEMPAA